MAPNGAYYTPEELDWLKAHIDDAPFAKLAKAFNGVFPRRKRTEDGLRWAAKQTGISKTVFRYTDDMIDFLRENRRGRSVQELTDIFNERFGLNVNKCSIEGQIKKWGICEPSFPIGIERTENGVVFVKVSDATGKTRKDWIQKHRHIWEQAHGKLKRGETVLFIDGDRRNFSLDNLYKVSHGVASNLRVYGWLFKGQPELQMCAIKWCECVEVIKRDFNPGFHMQEWERRDSERRKNMVGIDTDKTGGSGR